MRSLLFWDVLQRTVVVSYQRLEQLMCPSFRGKAVLTCLTSEDVTSLHQNVRSRTVFGNEACHFVEMR